MTTIEVKGVIVVNDYKEVYDWYGYESTSPQDVISQLPTDGSPIEIIINSGGGHVDAGSEIFSRLKAYEGKVTTKVYSLAASAASIIAMAGDTILIAPPAQLMIHNVSGGTEGDYRVHEKEAEVLANYNKAIASAYTLRTGKSEEEILQMMNDETWLSATQSVEQGFADEVMFQNDIQYVASTVTLLPSQVVNKARLMMKEKTSATSSTVEGITKEDFESFKTEILNLINKEEPTPVEPTKPTNKRKGFFF